jgi:hypothetical protein
MLAFVCSNVGDGSEDIASVSGSALDAIPMVDTTLSSLSIHVKVLQIIVEID